MTTILIWNTFLSRGGEGICEAVEKLMGLSSKERQALGEAGRAYVLEQKNPKNQCGRLYGFLQGLHDKTAL